MAGCRRSLPPPSPSSAFLAVNHDAARLWDRKYFAIFRSNQPEAFRTPEMVREAVENTDVLYYAEGVESIVSVIQVKGGEQGVSDQRQGRSIVAPAGATDSSSPSGTCRCSSTAIRKRSWWSGWEAG